MNIAPQLFKNSEKSHFQYLKQIKIAAPLAMKRIDIESTGKENSNFEPRKKSNPDAQAIKDAVI